MDIFKDIEGYEGLYQISNTGKVKSMKSGKILKNIAARDGYDRICLCGNGKRMVLIHRLIAEHFISNPMSKQCVNHINGIKTDNSIDNLEWVTHSENLIHAYANNLNKKPRPVARYDKDGVLVSVYKSARDAERDGFSNQNIAKCCKGKRHTHGGFKWSYHEL
tara:strand:- start:310 stop:798 length:489 start_codon:yes stop_codon:yes gene_type:complete